VSAKLAKVDATVATKLAERFAIKGFPTINFFRGGKKLEYQGGRVANEIVSWVKKQSGPAATTLNTAAEVEAAREKTDDAIVIGYFSSAESSSAKKFLDLASQNELLQFYISSSDAVKNALTLTGDTVVILKPFDDNRNDLSVSEFDSAEVAAFVAGNSAPLVQVFSQDAAKKIFSSPVQVTIRIQMVFSSVFVIILCIDPHPFLYRFQSGSPCSHFGCHD
jgi:protein disulfide-isomerase A1